MAESPLSVIKSYLVSLGFSVDKNSYDAATKTIDNASQTLSKFAGDTVKNFGTAGATVSTFLLTAAAGITKFLTGLGEAQIQYEMLARQLWTTQENAMALDTTLKAMGVTLQDLYLSPTLMKQFQELQKQAFQMMPPAEYQQEMSFVQSITFEFKRMKLESTYALQWIGYYLIKYLNGPLTNIHDELKNFNDMIVKSMPRWTKVIAEVLAIVFELAGTIVQTFKYVWTGIRDFFSMIPKNIKEVGLAFLGLGAMIEMGPMGIILGLILLLNDFYTYLKGGKSEFAPLWAGITGFYDRLQKSGVLKVFKKDIQDTFGAISKGIKDAGKYLDNFISTLQSNGTLGDFWTTTKNIFDNFNTVFHDLSHYSQTLFSAIQKDGTLKSLNTDFINSIQSVANFELAISNLEKKLLGLKSTNNALKELGKILTNSILSVLTLIDNTIKTLTAGLNYLTDLMNGNWAKAWKDFQKVWTNTPKLPTLGNQSYIYPGSNANTHNNNQKVTLTQQNYIYGSDPNQTAKAATNNMQDLIYRNVQGVIL